MTAPRRHGALSFSLLGVAGAAGALLLLACSNGTARAGFDDDPLPTDPTGETPKVEGQGFKDASAPENEHPPEINEVFGHSGETLYRLDTVTKSVAPVANFDGCTSILDIALDASSTLYGVTYTALYTIDKVTAKCTMVGAGSFPNSLSFIPKGALDPNEEALVGFEDADYVRIDTKTGAKTKIGALTGGLKSSGDIVSTKGGATYLTVKGGSCTANDCLVEIDPKNGKVLKNWGSVEHKNVFGLAFWAGKVYGFDDTAHVFEVTFGTSQLATSEMTIAQKPAGLKFWGAGSTTSAPLVPLPQ